MVHSYYATTGAEILQIICEGTILLKWYIQLQSLITQLSVMIIQCYFKPVLPLSVISISLYLCCNQHLTFHFVTILHCYNTDYLILNVVHYFQMLSFYLFMLGECPNQVANGYVISDLQWQCF